jgi:catechol 2,3-dioxygenase-like lactoylglutathione lyase family enzyme
MIKGLHAMFYTSETEALRAFLRDVLEFPASDVGEGWLIFDMPEAEMGCHPADADSESRPGTHNISFYCDDIQASVAELTRRGVQFLSGIDDRGYGLVTSFAMPGGVTVELYQPRYTKA